MRKFNLIFVFILISTLFSCTVNNFDDILFRNSEDPFDDVCITDSVTTSGVVYLSWKPDDACDSFILRRARDSINPDFNEIIYSGTETSFEDKVDEGEKFIYRLDKKRGKDTIFKGKEYAFGFCSTASSDSYESNNDAENATYLDYKYECNLTCAEYLYDGHQDFDKDWFSIEIPPRKVAEIELSQTSMENSSEQNPETDLAIHFEGKEDSVVKEKGAISISNTSIETVTVRFCILPKSSYSTAISTICYKIWLNKIYNESGD